jgi:hypothetical protein
MALGLLKRQIDQIDLRATTLAGLAAGAAYLATMEIDNRLSGRKLDDVLLLGRPFVEDKERARLLGLTLHGINSVTLAGLYAAVGRYRLPGPPWVRGAIFATVENSVLYPVAYFDEAHPARKAGEIDRYWSVSAYLWSMPRHVAYGAVLGALYDKLKRR